MRILVVGATGVLGRNVVPRLLEDRHRVRALVRRPDQAERLAAVGVETALGDILRRDTLEAAAAGCDVALHLATAIPRAASEGDWEMNDRIRREGTAHLLAACAARGIERYVQQSVTFLYGEGGNEPLDESTPVAPPALVESAHDMEGLVRASDLAWSILRGGLFYGPGTGWNEGLRQAARAGSLRLPGDGTDRLSLIHVVDMARAVALAATEAPPRSTFNVVDDQPVTYRELFDYVAALEGAAAPQPGGPRHLPSAAISNGHLKTALGWTPAYPSYRSGLAG